MPAVTHLDFFARTLDSPLYLPDELIREYAEKPSPLSVMAEITYQRTYAREFRWSTPRVQDLGARFGYPGMAREEWWLTCARVVEGLMEIVQRHQTLRDAWSPAQADKWSDWGQCAFKALYARRWAPAGRGLAHLGAPSLHRHGGAVALNCAFISTGKHTLADAVAWLMDMSMLGVGVGFDVDGSGSARIVQPELTADTWMIPDSREGWCEAARIAIRAWTSESYETDNGEGFSSDFLISPAGRYMLPVFNYSEIRPRGALINGFGGVADGPDALRKFLEVDIPAIFKPYVGSKLTATVIADVMNAAGKCVVSGNVRRSAEIGLSNWWDEEFAQRKNHATHPETVTYPNGDSPITMTHIDAFRWMSNDSQRARLGADYERFCNLNASGVEHGLMWFENVVRWGRIGQIDPNVERDLAIGVNPCGEQPLYHQELCNLQEVVPERAANLGEFIEAALLAFTAGKIVTLIPIHDPAADAIQRQNRRIGVGLTGVNTAARAVGPSFWNVWCEEAFQDIRFIDAQLSAEFGVNLSIRHTTAKPSGTMGKVLDVIPGVSWPTARYMLRAITFAHDHPAVPFLVAAGYQTRPCIATPNSVLVEVPMDFSGAGVIEHEVTLEDQLEVIAAMQRWWSDNSVSCTVKVAPQEWSQLEGLLDHYQHHVKSLSFLPKPDSSPETLAAMLKRYPDLPEIPITREEYEARTRDLMPVLWREITGKVHDTDDAYCDGDRCTLPVL